MKKMPLFLLLVAFAACNSKNATPVDAKGNAADSIFVSLNGIGDFKIEMKKEKVEKLLGRKILLPHISSDEKVYQDTAHCSYKNIDYMLVFTKGTQGDSANGITEITLSEVNSHAPLLRTRSGISIGDDIHKIVDAYDGHRLSINPEFNYTSTPPTRVKGKSAVYLFDDETGKTVIFYLFNNKVTSISVTRYEGD